MVVGTNSHALILRKRKRGCRRQVDARGVGFSRQRAAHLFIALVGNGSLICIMLRPPVSKVLVCPHARRTRPGRDSASALGWAGAITLMSHILLAAQVSGQPSAGTNLIEPTGEAILPTNNFVLLAILVGGLVTLLALAALLTWYHRVALNLARRTTEAESAMATLRASEERFRQIAQCAGDIIWEIDPQGLFTYASPGFQKLLGYTPEEVCGKLHYYDLFPESCREDLKAQSMAVISRKESFRNFPNPVVSKQGSLLHVETSGYPITDGQGHLLGYRGTDTDITARMHMESALRASEERHRGYVEHAPYGILVADEKQRIVEANPAACRMTGYSREELLSRGLPDLHPTDAAAAALNHFEQLMAGRIFQIELPYLTKSSERRYWAVTANKLTNNRFIGLMEDVTHRRQSDERIRLMARRAQAMLEMPHAATRLEEANFLQYALDVMEQLTGSTISFIHQVNHDLSTIELVAWSRNTLAQFCTATFQSHYPINSAGLWAEAFRTRTPVVVNDYATAPNRRGLPEGHSPLKRLISLPVINDGVVRMLVGVGNKDTPYTDADVETLQLLANEIWFIVNRGRMEKSLRASEQLLDETGQVGAIGGWEVDLRTRHLRWSAQTYRIHEVPLDYVPTLEEGVAFYPPESQALLIPAMREAEAHGTRWDLELPFVTARGRRLWVRATGQARLENGKPVVLLGIFQDITERKLKELEHAALQDQLLQAQKMESVGLLAGGIAHDFNNLLQAISGFCEILIAELSPEDRHRNDVREILKAAERASALTQQLLAFSRQQQLARQAVDLNSLVAHTRNMLARMVGEDIRLNLELAEGLEHVHADAGQVEQVVMNLVVNARDAMPEGGDITLTTRALALDEEAASQILGAGPGRYVSLEITDRGAGIPAEILPRIFDPFFTTKERGKGTGLGLSVVYGIVQQHQGFIDVRSTLGVGTTFRMAMPVFSPELCVETTPGLRHEPEVEPASGKGERILVVEDEAGVRHFLGQALHKAGYVVLLAEDLKSARHIMASAQPPIQMVLSDVVLPDGSGLDLAMELRQQQPGLPVLLASGYASSRARQAEVTEHGFVLLQKPYKLKMLLTNIHQHLADPAPTR
mgnify:CR=1 FL=1